MGFTRRDLQTFLLYRFFSACLPYLPVAAACFLASGLSLAQVLVLAAVYCVGSALFAVPLGAFADRFGCRRAMLAGSLALVTGAVIAASAEGFAAFVVAQLAFSLASALDSGADSAYLFGALAATGPDTGPGTGPGTEEATGAGAGSPARNQRYRDAEAVSARFKLLGNVAGFTVGGALAAWSPSAPFLAGGLFALFAAVLAWRLPARPGTGCARTTPAWRLAHYVHAIRELLGRPGLRRFVPLAALTVALAKVAVSVTAPYLESHSISLSEIGIYAGAAALLAAFLARHSVTLARRFGDQALLSAIPLALLVAYLAMGMVDGIWAVILACIPQVVMGLHAPLWRMVLNSQLGAGAPRATVLAMDGTIGRLLYGAMAAGMAYAIHGGETARDGGDPMHVLHVVVIVGAVSLAVIALVPSRSRRCDRVRRVRHRAPRLLWAGIAAALLLVFTTASSSADNRVSIDSVSTAAPVVQPALRPADPSAHRPDFHAVTEPATFLGESDDAILQRLCSEPIVRLKTLGQGSTLKYKAYFADGSKAVLRPDQALPQGYFRADIAAYRLSRALGLGTVPPACERTIEIERLREVTGDETWLARLDDELRPRSRDDRQTVRVSMVYWVQGVRDAGLEKTQRAWRPLLGQDHALPGDAGTSDSPDSTSEAKAETDDDAATLDQAREASRLIAWDFLLANWDRWSGGNTFRIGQTGPAVWLDNAAGFGRYRPAAQRRNERTLRRVQRFSRNFVNALQSADEATLRTALAPASLSDAEMDSLLARRDVLLAYIDELSAEHGADQVLAFD